MRKNSMEEGSGSAGNVKVERTRKKGQRAEKRSAQSLTCTWLVLFSSESSTRPDDRLCVLPLLVGSNDYICYIYVTMLLSITFFFRQGRQLLYALSTLVLIEWDRTDGLSPDSVL
jgi:hypothetical protein